MQNMDREELTRLLHDIADRVARGDSHEGKLQFLLGTNPDKPFEVAAIYRVDATLGTGHTELVGVNVAPLGCPKCGDSVGPHDMKTGRCDDCIEAAA